MTAHPERPTVADAIEAIANWRVTCERHGEATGYGPLAKAAAEAYTNVLALLARVEAAPPAGGAARPGRGGQT